MTEENREYRTSQIMLRNQFHGKDKFKIPIIPKGNFGDKDFQNLLLIGFDRTNIRDEHHLNRMVHFFLYDYKFERIWKKPDYDIEKLKRYRAVLSPDFSIYREMNPSLQLYNTFRNRLCGAYFASKGIRVIPTVSWGDENTFDFCFKGISKGSVVAVWGARDERPNTDESRGRDTQCGMFACTKVMRRFGVQYSYIWNCETESEDFRNGFDSFIRVVSVIKAVKNLRIAKFGARPEPFMSVTANEGDLATKLGVTVVPISPNTVAARMDQLIGENSPRLQDYVADVKQRMDASGMKEEAVERAAAAKLAIQDLMEEKHCAAGAMECWSAVTVLGAPVCMALGELSDEGLPVSCETDVNGAVTMAMLQAVTLGKEACFLADLTIRHPQNDNAELLWHCGPFPYSLKDSSSVARLVQGQERFELKKGPITVCRFDDVDGKYYLFGGEGKGVDGPETNGTYVWFETNNWKMWEEKLMFGPYIHHVGGIYGNYKKVLREAARYLGMIFDDADEQGVYSL